MTRSGLKHSSIAVLLVLLAISPFIELHAINQFIPARWSDSYSPWYAAKAAVQGVNPYSDQVTRQIQIWFYGHPIDQAHPGFDLQAYVYPATAIPLFALTTWVPWPVVRALFFFLAPLLMFASCFYWAVWSGAFRTRGARWIATIIATASVPSFWGIHLMQPSVLIFAGLAAVVALLSGGRDGWAGALLGIICIKPNLVAFLALWLLIVMARRRRWRFILAFGGVSAALASIAEWLVPAWPMKWLRAMTTYSHHKTSIFSFLFGHYASFAAVAGGILLLIALVKLAFPRPKTREFRLAVSLLLAYTVCVIPSGPWMIYNQILLIPPVLFLVSMRESSGAAHVMRMIALGFAWLVILSVVLCSALLLIFGPVLFAIRFPFSIYVLPASMLIALYCGCWDVSRSRVAATPPGGRSLDRRSRPFGKAASTPAMR